MPPSDISGLPDDLRVLVADDNVDAATSLCFLLQMLGCRTAVAYDGETAVRVSALFRPNVSFIDLDMPALDGCATLACIRAALPEHRQVFVCLTGRSETSDRARCLEAGFHAFVSKPIEPEALAALLATGREFAAQAAQRTPVDEPAPDEEDEPGRPSPSA